MQPDPMTSPDTLAVQAGIADYAFRPVVPGKD